MPSSSLSSGIEALKPHVINGHQCGKDLRNRRPMHLKMNRGRAALYVQQAGIACGPQCGGTVEEIDHADGALILCGFRHRKGGHAVLRTGSAARQHDGGDANRR